MKKAVILPFRCDHAPACSGPEVCPTKAIYYDEKTGVLKIDYEKCIGCGRCAQECPAKAILIVEEEKIPEILARIEDIDWTEIFYPKYGAEPMHKFYQITEKEFEREVMRLSNYRVIFAEFYSPEEALCRMNAIDYKKAGLWPSTFVDGKIIKTALRKIDVSSEKSLAEKYNINEVPTLIIFWKGKEIGRIEGAYTLENEREFVEKVKGILKGVEQ